MPATPARDCGNRGVWSIMYGPVKPLSRYATIARFISVSPSSMNTSVNRGSCPRTLRKCTHAILPAAAISSMASYTPSPSSSATHPWQNTMP